MRSTIVIQRNLYSPLITGQEDSLPSTGIFFKYSLRRKLLSTRFYNNNNTCKLGRKRGVRF